MKSIIRRKIAQARRMMDDAQNFLTHPRKAPMTCPAQPPANIPGASGKMNSQEKNSRNEKLKSLQAQAELLLDAIMEDVNLKAANVRILLILAELLEVLQDPEDPG